MLVGLLSQWMLIDSGSLVSSTSISSNDTSGRSEPGG